MEPMGSVGAARVPLVTVVIPTHHRCALLTRALRSATSQHDAAVQIIVVDDGSTDDTYATVAGLADDRICVVRHERPLGVSAARNRGIAEADGEWIAFLDDDDLWAPDKLRLQVASAEATGRDWSYGGSVTLLPTLEISGAGPPPSAEAACRDLPLRNIVPGGASNVVVRRRLLKRVGTFDPSLRHMSDWDLWIRLGIAGPPAVIDEPVVAYRLHAGNASNDTTDIAREMSVIERRYDHLRRGSPVDRAYVYRWIAWSALRMGRRREALTAYVLAIRAGDLASASRAVIGLARPALATWRMRHASDRRYEALAAQWLAPLISE